MIIVSQDKTEIINFDNINEIRATKTGKILLFDNTYRSQDDCSDVLGKYDTEERAKEILQEIIKSYRDYRTAECDGYTNVLQETAVFEMPED